LIQRRITFEQRCALADPAILERFDALNVWSRGDQRAVNKPLLLLYALGRWNQGDQSDIPFREVNEKLTKLLKEFGPPRQVLHPEYSFWRTQNDGVWTVDSPIELTSRQSNTDPLKSEMLAYDVRAGFSDDVKAAFRANPFFVTEVAARLLEGHFPESIHADILAEVGLTLGARSAHVRKRDGEFRQRVLVAYEFRCAVCGFDLKIGTVPVALDAAHIRWHTENGPDIENNGLALCSLHHKLFDLGAYTVGHDGVLLVSELVNGVVTFEDTLFRYHGKPIRKAQRPDWQPARAHVDWHRDQVFRGSPRHVELV
jgi:putative restriction endonuclease